MATIKRITGLQTEEEHLIQEESMVQPEEQEVKQEKTKDPIKELLELLSEFEGAPEELDLEQWKDTFGRIYVSSIDGDDVYIWRTIKRQEYKQIAGSGAMDEAMRFQEAVLRKCLLWPKPDIGFFSKSDAGVVPTLFEAVMHQSGFIPKEVAISMIRKV